LDSALERLRRDYTIAVRDFYIEELQNATGAMPQNAPLTEPLAFLDTHASHPTDVRTLTTCTFRVEVANRGSETWHSNGGQYPIFLSYHWTTDDGDTVVWDGLRTPLPRDVIAGDQIVVRILVNTPDEPGLYCWTPAIVQEGVQWIHHVGPTQLIVKVRA
jgi:hypothetical protein